MSDILLSLDYLFNHYSFLAVLSSDRRAAQRAKTRPIFYRLLNEVTWGIDSRQGAKDAKFGGKS